MELQHLLARARDLQTQLANDKQTLNVLGEQVEQAKAAFHTTNGRITELAYLIEQEQMLAQQREADEFHAAQMSTVVFDSMEGNDGEVIEQDQK